MDRLFKIILRLIGLAILFIVIYPFWLHKYPFSKKDMCWVNMYETGDSLFFASDKNNDTLIITHKYHDGPTNRFGFYWEGWTIWNMIELSHEYQAIVIYDYQIKHDSIEKKGSAKIKKSTDRGIDFSFKFGGIRNERNGLSYNKNDTIIIDLQNSEIVPNRRDFYIEGITSYKVTPTDGLIEYSFNDGRIYKLIEHRRYEAN